MTDFVVVRGNIQREIITTDMVKKENSELQNSYCHISSRYSHNTLSSSLFIELCHSSDFLVKLILIWSIFLMQVLTYISIPSFFVSVSSFVRLKHIQQRSTKTPPTISDYASWNNLFLYGCRISVVRYFVSLVILSVVSFDWGQMQPTTWAVRFFHLTD